MRSVIISASPTTTCIASRKKPRLSGLPADDRLAAHMRCDCRHQKRVVLARTAAEVGDLVELLLSLPDIVFQEIGLAEILACLGVARIDRERLTVIVDTLVDIAE